ncbi:FAD-binding oxidoreductase [Streptomyces scabiei]|uniref:FAD-binding oxidoreductase n=1 Tax=Streptomyces scabiei TaxID=1930 RepID=UPI001B32705A|nr:MULTISPECIES: FAD-binding oxidoreductase [Streptomyces]MBP5921591.1 FAD-binding oxidoreductase [Streptomyces sp. LBUM 1483]MDX3222041.1 FAD-binding oxidoreductase [Streptomyces scabiei]MDX3298412.1 FAD-binding oxidoreductase [Streptomyces scabiei]
MPADATGAPPAPSPPSPGRTVPVTGWGRTAPTVARLVRPRTYEEAAAAVRACGARGGIARGLGRAYGDAAQNAGGTVLDMTGLDRVHAVDADGGTVLCDAGVSLHRLMEVLLPLGWFVPVTPGTRQVTVGGAIAADIHGKNHHVSGSFARHVLSLELLTADGGIRTAVPGTPLFDATAGGMGLTGVILTATVRLLPVETSWMSVDTERARDLDDLLSRLTAGDHRHRYSVAWIDLLARGASTGRAVLTRGDHAPLAALEQPGPWSPRARAGRLSAPRARTGFLPGGGAFRPDASTGPLEFRPRRLPAAPAHVPDGLLGRTAVSLFNDLWYRRAPRSRTGELQRVSTFFHPLDGVPHWNRLYGRSGFVQYQFVVGHGQEEALRRIVRRISARRCSSFLAVLKRFGEGDPGWLSFPMPGWTLALDIPAGLPGLGTFLDTLDEEVAAAGGRVYLAKDARLRPELLAAMYPRLPEFRALRRELDPDGVFVSDLARRLGL